MSILQEAHLLITGSGADAVAQTLLAQATPHRLTLFCRNEAAATKLPALAEVPAIRCLTGDLREAARLRRALRGVDDVIYAPAADQVEGIGGVENLIEASLDCHVKRLLVLSPAGLTGPDIESRFIAAHALSGETGTRIGVIRHGRLVEPLVADLQRQAESGRIALPELRTTRFLFTAEDQAALILRALTDLRGGEVFVPRVPAVELRELAAAVAPRCPIRTTHRAAFGDRHECLIAAAEASRTLECEDYYLILPRLRNRLTHAPAGLPCAEGFRYASDSCPQRLSAPELREWLDRLSLPGEQEAVDLIRHAA